MKSGMVIEGPAIVEEVDSVTVLLEKDRAHVDGHGNITIDIL
jgi:hypothetical protein